MKTTSGFSLIELMISVAILAILIMLGVPTLGTTLDNIRVRGKAHSFLAGMQKARAEAVTRNTQVDFVMLAWNTPPTVASLAQAAVANGQNWMIRTNDQANFIEGEWGAEGSGGTVGDTPRVLVNDTNNDGAADAGTVGSVTFTGLGATTLGAAAFDFTHSTGGACAPAGPIRCLRVTVSIGGQARLCDPAVTAAQTAAGDTRGCI